MNVKKNKKNNVQNLSDGESQPDGGSPVVNFYVPVSLRVWVYARDNRTSRIGFHLCTALGQSGFRVL